MGGFRKVIDYGIMSCDMSDRAGTVEQIKAFTAVGYEPWGNPQIVSPVMGKDYTNTCLFIQAFVKYEKEEPKDGRV